MLGDGSYYRSYDAGHTMTPVNHGISDGGPWCIPLFMDYNDSAVLWTARNTKIYRTTDRMNTWVWLNNPAGLGGGVYIDQCRAHPGEVVVVGPSKVWLTTDSGASWSDRTGGLAGGGHISCVAVDPTDPDIFVVTVATYSANTHQVYKSTDQGSSWFPIDADLPDEPVNTIQIDPSHPQTYFIGSDNAVYLSQDGGATWAPFNTGLPYVVVDQLRIHDGARILRAGTHGRGLWEVDISNIPPPGAVGPVRAGAQSLALRVFGSPANGKVVFHYGLRQPGKVRLGLYDLQGRQVRIVVDDKFRYACMDDATVDLRGLASGIYFARLEANGAHVSQKVVVEH